MRPSFRSDSATGRSRDSRSRVQPVSLAPYLSGQVSASGSTKCPIENGALSKALWKGLPPASNPLHDLRLDRLQGGIVLKQASVGLVVLVDLNGPAGRGVVEAVHSLPVAEEGVEAVVLLVDHHDALDLVESAAHAPGGRAPRDASGIASTSASQARAPGAARALRPVSSIERPSASTSAARARGPVSSSSRILAAGRDPERRCGEPTRRAWTPHLGGRAGNWASPRWLDPGIETLSPPPSAETVDVLVELLAEIDAAREAGRLLRPRLRGALPPDVDGAGGAASSTTRRFGSCGPWDRRESTPTCSTASRARWRRRRSPSARWPRTASSRSPRGSSARSRRGTRASPGSPRSPARRSRPSGRWLGVIFADRGGGRFSLTDEERQTMWTLGQAGRAGRERRARHEPARGGPPPVGTDLPRPADPRARDSAALRPAPGARVRARSSPPSSARCATTRSGRSCTSSAWRSVGSLRAAYQRAETSSVRRITERVATYQEGLTVDWAEGAEVPAAHRAAGSVGAARGAAQRREARPGRQRSRSRSTPSDDAFVLEVVNDGVGASGMGAGLGLRHGVARGAPARRHRRVRRRCHPTAGTSGCWCPRPMS